MPGCGNFLTRSCFEAEAQAVCLVPINVIHAALIGMLENVGAAYQESVFIGFYATVRVSAQDPLRPFGQGQMLLQRRRKSMRNQILRRKDG